MAEVKAMTGWTKTGGFFGAVKPIFNSTNPQVIE
jgi:hypothetical protein